MENEYANSIKKWKESLIIEKRQLNNDIDHLEIDIKLSKQRIKLAKESLFICKSRILEADKILKDGKKQD